VHLVSHAKDHLRCLQPSEPKSERIVEHVITSPLQGPQRVVGKDFKAGSLNFSFGELELQPLE
jgi:hypothetical protein